jgi:hypothetical protein
MNCHTCRTNIEIFKVYGNIKGDCVVCFEKNVDIIMFKCGHYICKDCKERNIQQQQIELRTEEIPSSLRGDYYAPEIHNYDISDVVPEYIIQESLDYYYGFIDELEYRVPHLGSVAEHVHLDPENMIRLKNWIDSNNVDNCNKILECFDDVIEVMHLTFTPTIEFFRDELESVIANT